MHIVSSLFSYVFMLDLCDAAQQRPFYGLDSLSLLFFFSSQGPKPGRMPYYLIRKFNNNVRTSCNRMANYLNDSPLSLSQFRPFYHITMPFYLFPPPKTAKTKRIWPCFPTNDMYDVSNISIFYHIIHYIYISIVCVRMYAGRGHSDKM